LGIVPHVETPDESYSHGTYSAADDDVRETAGNSTGNGKTLTQSGNVDRLTKLLSLSGLMIFVIGLYRKIVSPWLPPCCRFSPTCSQYAIEALRVHGFLKGMMLATWRILRCQPFCKGGYDPVPAKKYRHSTAKLKGI
jgi:putative membrane protein insertion efficiency factor